MISASMVKDLREATGAGMLDCKKALEASNGNMEEAITWLREKGISKAAKKASRIAAEGLAVAKVDGNRAVVVEVNSETDFVAKNEEFKNLVNAIADTVLKSDVKTVEEAMTAAEKEHKKGNKKVIKTEVKSAKTPLWFDKDIARNEISDGEDNQLEELLKEYK